LAPPLVSDTGRPPRSFRLPVADAVIALAMGLPVIALVWLAVASLGDTGAFGSRMLPVALRETGLLLLGVGAATAVIGLVSAWIVAHFSFPGRRIAEWAFILPLAIPTYLSAFAWVEVLEFTGPVQGALRALIGAETAREYWFPAIRSLPGAAFVMSLVLYPYVYLSCRAYFFMQSGAVAAAARTLGASPARTFWRIVLPLSRPALIVGVTLALLEVMNDLGAVEFFGVNSLTAVVYATWINRSDLPGAAQLAVTLVLVVLALIWLEQYARRRRAYLMPRDNQTPPPRTPLGGIGAALAIAFSVAVIGLGFAVPFGTLAFGAWTEVSRVGVPAAVWTALWQTVALALAGALICVVFGYFTAARMKSATAGRPLIRLATLGYAMPGTVLAIGLVVPLGALDGAINDATRALFGVTVGLVFTGSVFALVYAYAVRFLTVTHSSLLAGMSRRGENVLEAARVLGANRRTVLLRVDLPTLRPALIGAATLAFVECIKELPATLMLRPLGIDTLATYVYAEAKAELFAAAAVPALLIVAVGLVPVLLAGMLRSAPAAAGLAPAPEAG
jgi:iron(III) transport system permease protein